MMFLMALAPTSIDWGAWEADSEMDVIVQEIW